MNTGSASEKIGPVLITGGNGFLGKALSKHLMHIGEEVVALDLGFGEEQRDGIIRVTADIMDMEMLEAVAQRYRVRAIVHLAALVIPACKSDPVKGAQINIIGHLNMLELARRLSISRFVYTSSVAARPRGELVSPVNLYGVYKKCCEDISKVWFLDHGLATVGLRPNVVYGPGREQGETAAITLAIKAAARGERYQMPFAGSMGFQYLDEVVDIINRCLQAKPELPMVSDISEHVESTADVLRIIQEIEPNADILPSDNMRAAPPELDNGPLRALLGHWSVTDLQEGIRQTFVHYKNQA